MATLLKISDFYRFIIAIWQITSSDKTINNILNQVNLNDLLIIILTKFIHWRFMWMEILLVDQQTIKVWSESGVLKNTFTYHNSGVCSLVILPNGDLASGSTRLNNCIKIADINYLALMIHLRCHRWWERNSATRRYKPFDGFKIQNINTNTNKEENFKIPNKLRM